MCSSDLLRAPAPPPAPPSPRTLAPPPSSAAAVKFVPSTSRTPPCLAPKQPSAGAARIAKVLAAYSAKECMHQRPATTTSAGKPMSAGGKADVARKLGLAAAAAAAARASEVAAIAEAEQALIRKSRKEESVAAEAARRAAVAARRAGEEAAWLAERSAENEAANQAEAAREKVRAQSVSLPEVYIFLPSPFFSLGSTCLPVIPKHAVFIPLLLPTDKGRQAAPAGSR